VDNAVFEKQLNTLLAEDNDNLAISDPVGLRKLVGANRDLAEHFVSSELASGANSFINLQRIAYVALMHREIIGPDSAWERLITASQSMSTTAREIIAAINLLGSSNFHIDAPERIRAIYHWLSDHREVAYCDSCPTLQELPRGDGYMKSSVPEPNTTLSLPSNTLVTVFAGDSFLCEKCFRAGGGIPRRYAYPDERPTSNIARERLRQILSIAPPPFTPSEIISKLEVGRLSLHDLSKLTEQELRARSIDKQKRRFQYKTAYSAYFDYSKDAVPSCLQQRRPGSSIMLAWNGRHPKP
jgi:hypothetical protein